MKCRKVRNNLSAYADGELSSRLRRNFEAHLAACEKCAAELASLREVAETAKTSLRTIVSEKAPPHDLRERVMRAAEPAPLRRPVLIPAARLAAAAVVIALASGFLVGVGQELRFRSEREALRRKIAEQRHEITQAKADSGAARTQLTIAEARLAAVEKELQLASTAGKGGDRLVEEVPGPARRPWPPVFSSLQLPGAEGILSNGLF